jgi:hypothetical protein
VQTRNVWSNAAVALGQDPCGNPSATPGLGAFPVLFDSYNGNAAAKIAPGTSFSVPLKVYSYGPLGASMSLQVFQTNTNSAGTNSLSFSFDKTTAQNGDIVNLTITAPTTPFTSTTGYGAFVIEATVPDVKFPQRNRYGFFPGLVTN